MDFIQRLMNQQEEVERSVINCILCGLPMALKDSHQVVLISGAGGQSFRLDAACYEKVAAMVANAIFQNRVSDTPPKEWS